MVHLQEEFPIMFYIQSNIQVYSWKLWAVFLCTILLSVSLSYSALKHSHCYKFSCVDTHNRKTQIGSHYNYMVYLRVRVALANESGACANKSCTRQPLPHKKLENATVKTTASAIQVLTYSPRSMANCWTSTSVACSRHASGSVAPVQRVWQVQVETHDWHCTRVETSPATVQTFFYNSTSIRVELYIIISMLWWTPIRKNPSRTHVSSRTVIIMLFTVREIRLYSGILHTYSLNSAFVWRPRHTHTAMREIAGAVKRTPRSLFWSAWTDPSFL